MRNKLIDGYGAYLEPGFKGSNGNWRLVGSESPREDCGILETLDTFRSDKGEFKTMTRKQVDELFELGKIKL